MDFTVQKCRHWQLHIVALSNKHCLSQLYFLHDGCGDEAGRIHAPVEFDEPHTPYSSYRVHMFGYQSYWEARLERTNLRLPYYTFYWPPNWHDGQSAAYGLPLETEFIHVIGLRNCERFANLLIEVWC